ncbi:autotransporter domain-containing protein [Mesorhizobium sp. CU2]|uniref:autotransporter domain-containing protein n=1 Tax=Mesorhizobium sp. CU2 TaxID=2589985 RepID=UPI0011271C7D|nr:autotransporter domain-containing protein [Mesorhizobium sp. CU2]TPO20305.1 autotransporter domain-containing protein [Mesorhizobium sp. CU2]
MPNTATSILFRSLMACTALVAVQSQARAADIMVSDAASLSSAISNASSGDRIILQNDIALGTTLLPPVLTNVSIDGQGHTIDAQGNNRIFFLDSKDAVPAVSIENVTLKGGAAKGGDGGNGNGASYDGGGAGGGGGMGAWGNGGNGGFGGGAGGGYGYMRGPGTPGIGGGYAYQSGGGGAGFGGAVFVRSGASITIADGSFEGGSATAGGGYTAGASAGSDLFLMSGTVTTFNPTGTLTINGTIADDSQSSLPTGQSYGAGCAVGPGCGAAIAITGGTVVLNGANTFSGGMSVQSRVRLGNSSAAGTGAITSLGATIDYADGISVANPIELDADGTKLNVDSGSAEQSGAISESGGSFSLDKTGNGALTLSGANTYSGGTLVSAGTIVVGADTIGSHGAIVSSALGTGDVTLDGGTLQAGGSYTVANDIAVTAKGASIDNNGNVFTLTGTITDGTTGGGTLTFLGAGTTELTGANTYSGGSRISAGTVVVDTDTVGSHGAIVSSALGTGGVTLDGATLQAGGSYTVANDIAVSAKGASIDNNGNAFTLSGTVTDGTTGGGMLTFLGTGTTELTGANTYSGGSLISAGTIVVGVDTIGSHGAIVSSALGTGTVTLDGATLQAGGSYTVDNDIAVSAKGSSIDNDGNAFTLTGTITDGTTGGGTLTFLGSGTTDLAGANTYTGATYIDSGATLAIKGGGSIASSAMISFGQGGGTLDISQANSGASVTEVSDIAGNSTIALGAKTLTITRDSLFAGVIQDGGLGNGTGGSLVVADGASLELRGANSFTGSTRIQDGGELQLSDEGSLAASSEVAADGVLDISASTATAGVSVKSLTGGGAVYLGDIELHITNANGAFDGSISDCGTDGTSCASIQSGGGLTLESGTLTLNGVNTYTGETTVSGGKLIIGDDSHAGASLASAVTVGNGGSLGGIGTISGLTVNQGGAVGPGNSIGTLTVTGDVTLAAGSIFAVEIAGNGSSDRIAADGKATLGGGQVEVRALDSRTSYKTGQTYTILTATGGIDGSFDPTVLSKSAFLSAQLSQDANSVDLTIARTKDASFASIADSPNGKQTGAALDTLEQSGPSLVLYNKLLSLSADEGGAAFDQLSGEIHGSTVSGLITDSQKLRDAIGSRLDAAFNGTSPAPLPIMAYGDDASLTTAAIPTERFAAWGSAFGSWGSIDGDGNTAKLSHSTGGLVTGADGFVTDDWLLGMLAGYSHSSFKTDRGDSSASSDNYHLGVYGGAEWGALALRTGLAYSWSKIDTGRSVAFPDFADNLSGSYRAGTTQVFGELGYTIKAGGIALEPFANLAYVDLDTDGFSEHGGAAALNVEGGSNDVTFTTLGLRASGDFDLGGLRATGHGTIGWLHAYGDTAPAITQAFEGSASFTVTGAPIASDSAILEAGLDFAITPAARLGITYNGQVARETRNHAFRADLDIKF